MSSTRSSPSRTPRSPRPSPPDPEKDHLTEALRFEVGEVARKDIRDRVVDDILVHVDPLLAEDVGRAVGTPLRTRPAPRDPGSGPRPSSPALSMIAASAFDSVEGRTVAILVADGVRAADVRAVKETLLRAGAFADLVPETMGPVTCDDGSTLLPHYTLLTAPSVVFDALHVPGGAASVAQLAAINVAERFLRDAWRHCKPLAFSGEAVALWEALRLAQPSIDRPGVAVDDDRLGVIVGGEADARFVAAFSAAIAQHRFWGRQKAGPLLTMPPPTAVPAPASAPGAATRRGRRSPGTPAASHPGA